MDFLNNDRVPRLQLLGPLLFFAIFFIIPITLTFVWAFWPRTQFWMEPGFTLHAYRDFYTTGRFEVYLTSLKISIVTVSCALVLGYPVAYYLARKLDDDVAFPLLFLFVLPFIVNDIIVTFAWRSILGREGPINQLLMGVGVISEPLNWLLFSEIGVYIGLVVTTLPFVVFPVWLSLRNLNDSWLEASMDLGASPLTTFRTVVFPLSLPGVFAATIFVFVVGFGSTTIPTLLGGGDFSVMGSSLLSVLGILNYPLAAAIATISIGTMIILLLLWSYLFNLKEMITLRG